MKRNLLFTLVVFVLAATVASGRGQQPAGVPVHVVVAVEAHKGKEPPIFKAQAFDPGDTAQEIPSNLPINRNLELLSILK